MKDPAFLFYYQDFIVGCSDLTNEETGAYIKCLCIQAAKGGITEKHMLIICSSPEVHATIKEKFIFNPEINLYENFRLRTEVEKRRAYSESRSRNRKSSVNKDIPPSKKLISYVKHMEDENENEDINENEIENEDIIENENTIEKKIEVGNGIEKIKVGAICDFFDISKKSQPQDYFNTSLFLKCLAKRNLITHFEQQFHFYKILKTQSGYKHGFKKFVGSADKFYEDGAWNSENWETKVPKIPEKTTFANVGKNQDDKYEKMRIQFANRR